MRINPNDYINNKYGKLIVISTFISNIDNQTYCVCKCECGNIKNVLPYHLKKSLIVSCGCNKLQHAKDLSKYKKSKIPHNYKGGITKHPLYGTWRMMIDRCKNPKNSKYNYYGGKGISVCNEWLKFENFALWCDTFFPNRENKTLDRIDIDKNYEPSNCRFVDWSIQSNNKSSNRNITYNGETHTIAEWSNILNIKYRTLNNRINRGWSIQDAFNRPVKYKG